MVLSQLPPLDADSLDLYRQLFMMKVQSVLKKYQKLAEIKTQPVLSKLHDAWLNLLSPKLRKNIMLYLIYGIAPPFFGHPLKLLFQTSFLPNASKQSYAKAYEHFRRDHRSIYNQIFHVGALVFQLLHNFAWLHRLDKYLFNKSEKEDSDEKQEESVWRPLSGLTAICWAALVLKSSAPVSVKAFSLLSLRGSYNVAPYFTRNWKTVLWLQGLCDAYIMTFLPNFRKHTLKLHGDDGESAPEFMDLEANQGYMITTTVARTAIIAVIATLFRKSIVKNRNAFFTGLACLQGFLALRSSQNGDPEKYLLGMPIIGAALSLITNSPALFHYASGYKGTLLQGTCHAHSGEMATLVQLDQMKDVLAHITFFPNLVFHSLSQTMEELHNIQTNASSEQWIKGAPELVLGL